MKFVQMTDKMLIEFCKKKYMPTPRLLFCGMQGKTKLYVL